MSVVQHLVTIAPAEDAADPIEARRRILTWEKARAIAVRNAAESFFARVLSAMGMVCEIDAEDLAEAMGLGVVTIHGTKVDGVALPLSEVRTFEDTLPS